MTSARLTLSIDKVRKRILEKALETRQQISDLSVQYLVEDPIKTFANGKFKTSTVSLGKDPRVGSQPLLIPPTITSGEIKLDGLGNPYVIVNFSIPRSIADGNKIIAFNVHRKKVKAIDLNQNIDAFTAKDFDQISRNTTRRGKFSQERKAQHDVDAEQQSQVSRNPNLFDLQESSNSQNLGSAVTAGASLQSQFGYQDLLPGNEGFTIIAQVNYANQQTQLQMKQTYVKNDATVTGYYADYNVAYGSAYTYTVTAYCKNGSQSTRSAAISMVVLNLDGIGKASTFAVRQVDSSSVQLTATFNAKDKIRKALIFKKTEEETRFELLEEWANSNNTFEMTDGDVVYLTTYIYRIILVNVFGAISEPSEFKITCSSQNTTSKSRSHNLLFPIMLASQDSNSDNTKVTIYPNDPRILYYEITRRNLTASETRYGVPRNKNLEFWATNKFFVPKQSAPTITSGTLALLAQGSLPPQTQFTRTSSPITFVDMFVTSGNTYQYRVLGYDAFSNVSAGAFSTITASPKKAIRAPINLRFDILRETPFRVKIMWDDDNVSVFGANDIDAKQRLLEINLKTASLSAEQEVEIQNLLLDVNLQKLDVNKALEKFNLRKEQLEALKTQFSALTNLSNPVRFQLQRRDLIRAGFSTFPLTQNQFVIDEVPASDAVPFSSQLIDDTYTSLSGSPMRVSRPPVRPFNVPQFLWPDTTYEYRVAAVDSKGAASAYSTSIYVDTDATLPNLVDVTATVLNPNVTPCVVVLGWTTFGDSPASDHFRIERKVNIPSDSFRVIGTSYLEAKYFDRDAELGNQYIYRIRAVSFRNAESAPVEVTVNT